MGLLRESSVRDRRAALAVLSAVALFLLLDLLLFPRPLGQELTLTPARVQTLTPLEASGLEAGGRFVVLGSWEAYRNAAGTVVQAQPRRHQVAVEGASLAWVGPEGVRVEGTEGPRFLLEDEQYPAWIGSGLFTFDENRLALTAWNDQGKRRWSWRFSSLITAVDRAAAITAVGTLDGQVRVFDDAGQILGSFQPGGSRLPVVYNLAVSPRQDSILVLAGVDPKRFLILQKGGTEYRPVYHKPLVENRPWPTPLGFLADGSVAYYQTAEGLAFLDPRTPEVEHNVSFDGEPILVRGLFGDRLVLVVARTKTGATLRVLSPSGQVYQTLPFQGAHIALQVDDGRITLGLDQTLVDLEARVQ